MNFKSVQMNEQRFYELFTEILDFTKYGRTFAEAFEDWCEFQANAFDLAVRLSAGIDDALEIRLQSIRRIKAKYDDQALIRFEEALELLTDAIEYECKDWLGPVVMKSNINNKRNGAFYTPSSISRFVAEMVGDRALDTGENIADPSCGSGAMLLAYIQKKRKDGRQDTRLYVGQDISIHAVHMAQVQLFVSGVWARVVCANTITHPDDGQNGENVFLSAPIQALSDTLSFIELSDTIDISA